jgi:hypothetical protein
MSRPEPIEYAERLYAAIRDANFSPISFLAFGNAVKDGVPMRSMPRIAAEPFMRVVGEMLDLEERVQDAEVIEAAGELAVESTPPVRDASSVPASSTTADDAGEKPATEGPVGASPRKHRPARRE